MKLSFCLLSVVYGTPNVNSFAVRFSALSKIIFDNLLNSQFKYTVFDYLLNNQIC